MITAFTLFFYFLCSGSIIASALFNRRFEEIVPITVCSIVFTLFFFGLFGWLIQGLYVVFFALSTISVYSIIHVVRSKKIHFFFLCFFTPCFFIFVLMYIAIIVLHYGRQPSEWDEFSHWATVVKCMVGIDGFITNPATSQMMFRSYVPGMALFQYFLQKIIIAVDPSITFCEWALYLSYHIFALSFFLPFLKGTRFQVFLSSAILFFLLFLSPEIAFREYYLSTVYIDPFVGLVSGAGFAFLFQNNNTDTISCLYIMLVIAVLVLAKDVGILFAAFLSITFIFQIFLFKKIESKQDLLRSIFLSVGTISAVIVPKICWNIHLKIWQVSKSFSSPIKPKVLWSVLSGTDKSYLSTVFQYYKEFLFHAKPIISWFGVEFTYPMLLISYTSILIMIYIITRHSVCSKKYRLAKKVIIGIVFFQTCFYAFGLLVIYLFRFDKRQAINLASAYRYMEIPILAFQTMILLTVMANIPSAISWKRYIAIGLILTLILPAFPKDRITAFLTRSSVRDSVESRKAYDNFSEEVIEKLQEPPYKLYIIAQESTGYSYWALRYTLKPNTVNEGAWSISPGGAPLYEGDSFTKKKSPEEWKDELQNYDFVVLFEITSAFKTDYGDLSARRYFIHRGLYKINHETHLLEAVH